MGSAVGVIGGVVGGAAGIIPGRECAKAFDYGMKCQALGMIGGASVGAGLGSVMAISIQHVPEGVDLREIR